jgi:hypothetical protein
MVGLKAFFRLEQPFKNILGRVFGLFVVFEYAPALPENHVIKVFIPNLNIIGHKPTII